MLESKHLSKWKQLIFWESDDEEVIHSLHMFEKNDDICSFLLNSIIAIKVYLRKYKPWKFNVLVQWSNSHVTKAIIIELIYSFHYLKNETIKFGCTRCIQLTSENINDKDTPKQLTHVLVKINLN